MCFDDSLRLNAHQSLLLQYTESKFPGVSYNKDWVPIYVFERIYGYNTPQSITRQDIFFGDEENVDIEFILRI
jgi:hypothetical protein